MSERNSIQKAVGRGSPAALVAQIPLLVLDVSNGGCLFESQRPMDEGRVGTVRLALSGGWYVEDIRVTRCVPVPGRGSTYHVGAEFLRTRRPPDQSLRSAIGQIINATQPDPEPKTRRRMGQS